MHISQMPHTERKKLCKLLDYENKYEELKKLGLKLGFNCVNKNSSVSGAIRRIRSSTDELLTLWGEENRRVDELFILLSNMKHYRAMKIIKDLVDEGYHCLIRETNKSNVKSNQGKEKVINKDLLSQRQFKLFPARQQVEHLQPQPQLEPLQPQPQLELFPPQQQLELFPPQQQIDFLAPQQQFELFPQQQELENLPLQQQFEIFPQQQKLENLPLQQEFEIFPQQQKLENLPPQQQFELLQPQQQFELLQPQQQFELLQPQQQFELLQPQQQLNLQPQQQLELLPQQQKLENLKPQQKFGLLSPQQPFELIQPQQHFELYSLQQLELLSHQLEFFPSQQQLELLSQQQQLDNLPPQHQFDLLSPQQQFDLLLPQQQHQLDQPQQSKFFPQPNNNLNSSHQNHNTIISHLSEKLKSFNLEKEINLASIWQRPFELQQPQLKLSPSQELFQLFQPSYELFTYHNDNPTSSHNDHNSNSSHLSEKLEFFNRGKEIDWIFSSQRPFELQPVHEFELIPPQQQFQPIRPQQSKFFPHVNNNPNSSSLQSHKTNTSQLPQKLNSLIAQIPYDELKRLTNNWDKNVIVGNGRFGTVFKAIWKNKQVAIKRIEQKRRDALLFTELHCLNVYTHKNILELYRCSTDGLQPCLIYEYMQGGSLDYRLHTKDSTKSLNWRTRLNIAIGIANGLNFLHTAKNGPLIHCGIKPANILLDSNNNPRIAEFGLVRYIKPNRLHSTRPYLPNEFKRDRKVSIKFDTYSFGIVLFEMGTALYAYCHRRKYRYLRDVVINVKDDLMKLKDPRGGNFSDGYYLFLMKTGKLCIQELPEDRPEIDEILKALKVIKQVLIFKQPHKL